MPQYDSVTQLRKMQSCRIDDIFSIKDKVCVVTGGTRGIGLMIAKGFVQNGARVYVVSRKSTVCQRVSEELNAMGPGTAYSLPADLRSDKACRELVERFASRESKLDCLVNNAGVTWGDSFEDFPEKAWDRTMTLNVASIFHLTRAFVPYLKKASKGNEDPSHVINISSVAGNPTFAHAMDNAPSYAASKAACNKVTQILAAYLKDDFICVNAIAPAVFPSKMTFDYQLRDEALFEATNRSHPLGRIGNARDMAGTSIFLASKASAFMTGSVVYLDGGTTAVRSSL